MSFRFPDFSKSVARVMLLVGLMDAAAMAQTVSFGGKVGLPISDAFSLNGQASLVNNYTADTRRFTAGPSVEVVLPSRLSIEADALYRRLSYASNPFGFDTFRATTTGNSWEFPVLIKRDVSSVALHPYGALGVSFRRVEGTTTLSNGTIQSTQDPLELVRRWSTGFVAGGGVQLPLGPIRFLPEIRYTRWANENFSAPSGVLNSNLNAVDFLVGVLFHKRP